MFRESDWEEAGSVQRVLGGIALATALTALIMAFNPYQSYMANDPRDDGYVPPRSVGNLVEFIQDATVTITCDTGKKYVNLGSGWAINMDNKLGGKNSTTVITNHHVIENCINQGKIWIYRYSDDLRRRGYIEKYDEENDLAVMATSLDITPLKLAQYPPKPGYWVMAVGNPDGLSGSVSFGNVLNVAYRELYSTASISHGNSGGPLVDNEGSVIGVNTGKYDDSNYFNTVSLDGFCSVIIECEYSKGEDYWDWG